MAWPLLLLVSMGFWYEFLKISLVLNLSLCSVLCSGCGPSFVSDTSRGLGEDDSGQVPPEGDSSDGTFVGNPPSSGSEDDQIIFFVEFGIAYCRFNDLNGNPGRVTLAIAYTDPDSNVVVLMVGPGTGISADVSDLPDEALASLACIFVPKDEESRSGSADLGPSKPSEGEPAYLPEAPAAGLDGANPGVIAR